MTQYQSIKILSTEFMKSLLIFSPNTQFLSDIIAFQGAVIAIAIPLSFEIIARISERYQSGILVEKFNQQWQISWLLRLLVIDIFIAVCLKFFVSSDKLSGVGLFFGYVAFIVFIVTLFILLSFFNILRSYTVDTSFLLDKIYQDIDKNFNLKILQRLPKRKLESRQKQFIYSLEGIADILEFEAKNKKGQKLIEEGLDKIKTFICQILEIQESNPKLYNRLLLSDELSTSKSKNFWSNEDELRQNPEKYLITTAINQILRVHEAALEARNIESHKIIWVLMRLLADLTHKPDRDLLVKQVLNALARARLSTNIQDSSSAYYTSIRWYSNIVFHLTNKFELSYLNLFDDYFWRSIKYIISQNQTQLFQDLVQIVNQEISIPYFKSSSPFLEYHLEYENLEPKYDIKAKLDNLHETKNN